MAEEQKKDDKELARKVNEQVAMLMDELKSIFRPDMKLTFIARLPSEPTFYTMLTEEKDFIEFVSWLNTAQKPSTVVRAQTSKAEN